MAPDPRAVFRAMWGISPRRRKAVDEAADVVAFVGTERCPRAPRQLGHHRQRGFPFRGARGLGHSTADDEAVAILDRHVPQIRELGFLARALLSQARVGIGRRGVRGIAPALAVEVDRGMEILAVNAPFFLTGSRIRCATS